MTGLSVLSEPLQQRLRSELQSDETLHWVGQPDPGKYMKSGFALWLFFVPWTAFALFWIAGASGFKLPKFDSGESLFPLFGLPFLLIGLAGLSAPFWMRRQARSIIYAVTNKRALSIEGAKSFTVKSYWPADLSGTARKENPDGSGDLILHTEHYRDSDGDRRSREHGFLSIQNVREVERLVEALRRRDV